MNASVQRPLRQSRRYGELGIVVALAALLGVSILGLFLLARDEPSARVNSPGELPTPMITQDQGCANFAAYWMAVPGLTIDTDIVQGMTNCWQAADGSWIVPTGPNDDRLPKGFAMSAAEREATNPLRARLVAQMTELSDALSTSMQRDLDSIYDPRVRPVTGHIRDGVGISRPRGRYTRVVQAFLMAPAHKELADYVGWIMNRKILAYDRLESQCQSNPDTAYLRTVCDGLEDSLSIRFPPFLWDMRGSVLMEAYLAQLVRSGRIPPASSARSQLPMVEIGLRPALAWRRPASYEGPTT